MSKCLSRFRPKVKFLLDLESFEMHFYPHVDSCYRKGQVLSLTNELISTKFELVKFFKRLFSIIVFIFEVFETWAESKMSMLPGNEKSLLLVLLTPGDRVNWNDCC